MNTYVWKRKKYLEETAENNFALLVTFKNALLAAHNVDISSQILGFFFKRDAKDNFMWGEI